MMDMVCFYDAKMEFQNQLIVESCDCLPDCISISYNAEISQGPYHYFDDDDIVAMGNSFNGSG